MSSASPWLILISNIVPALREVSPIVFKRFRELLVIFDPFYSVESTSEGMDFARI